MRMQTNTTWSCLHIRRKDEKANFGEQKGTKYFGSMVNQIKTNVVLFPACFNVSHITVCLHNVCVRDIVLRTAMTANICELSLRLKYPAGPCVFTTINLIESTYIEIV